MKIILWAEIMANGFYPHRFQTPAEIVADFYEHVAQAGHVIFRRKTVEGVRAAGGDPHFAQVDMVAVSRQVSDLPGVLCATSPQQAVDVVQARGHTVAFVGGGETILN